MDSPSTRTLSSVAPGASVGLAPAGATIARLVIVNQAKGDRHPKVGAEHEGDVAAYIAGDEQAGGRICRRLEPVIRAEVARFLPDRDAERDDIVQETLVSLLAYLRKAGKSPERMEAFVVTMAANRCRNLYRWRKRRPSVELESTSEWLSADGEDPLDLMEAGELEGLVRDALSRLDAPCRQLLLAIYADRRSMEDLQREAGLGTVQGVYYRKYACLKKLAGFLNPTLFRGQKAGTE